MYRQTFLFDVTVFMFIAEWDRQTDQSSVCLPSTAELPSFTLSWSVFCSPTLSSIDSTWGLVPTPAYIAILKHTPRIVATKRYSNNRPNAWCPAAVLPSVQRSSNPLNPLHYVSLLKEEWNRPNCMYQYVSDVTHWRKPLIVLSTGYRIYLRLGQWKVNLRKSYK